ncbi:MAG: hypothetical protein V2J20_14345 [Wenzhouxiangella sp.]|jgi:hypothetical protein|nr:hypothetical protein [Wenzhouxiangella sp.]
MKSLTDVTAEDLAQPGPDGIQPLLDILQQRYGDQLQAVLLYGSCRRDTDVHDGLVDLLAIVKSYRRTHSGWLSGTLNWSLPPNVYFLQADSVPSPVRCKYAVITLSQFIRRCRSFSDHYFWARFTQPSRLVYTSDPSLLPGQIAVARALAARQYCRRVAPLNPRPMTARDLWELALQTTYRCELRPEPPGNARRLIDADPDFWESLTAALAHEGVIKKSAPNRYLSTGGSFRTAVARTEWQIRRVTGKLFNLARLFKAAGTFSNGIDYITWKVERHSGIRVEATERMRRYPRLSAWGLAWRMWRQGGFR